MRLVREVWLFGKRYVWIQYEGQLELRRWRSHDIVEVEPAEDGWRQFKKVREE